MGKGREELLAENELLRQEIRVAREAADITSELVVRQFEQTEQMLRRFQIADGERQAVLDGATQLSIISTDLSGTINMFSQGAITLLGYTAAEMIGSRTILSLHRKEELENYGREIAGVVESTLSGMQVFDQYVKQKRARAREWTYIRKDGSFLPVSLSITGLLDAEGRMIGYLFTAMDMTVRKELEEKLIEAKEMAESANNSKGDFLARMSHEIRTPMNAVIGMSYLLQKTELTHKQEDYVEKILSSANNLLGLINDILDFSKIDAGKLKLESISFDLEDVLGHLINVVGLHAEKKGLEFLFRVEPDVPCNLEGDPLRLGQVLMNLANNAIKFTERGEIVIAVCREKSFTDSVELRFTVHDSGIGLSPAQIDQIFDAFTQADDSITRKYGGTGLGLAICRQLIDMMDGRIWIESEPGQGTDFNFTARFALSSERCNRNLDVAESFKGLHALVVDDNEIARDVLSSMLTSLRMKVDCAEDGREALAKLKKSAEAGSPYDVVLLDWIMPGMDGIETARRIKEDADLARVPAMLMVTANGREEARIEAERIGLDAFLIKPVYASVMYDTLLQLLGIEAASAPRISRKKIDNTLGLLAIRGARILLVEDNPINQQVATEFLKDAGMVVEIAASGQEAIDAVAAKSFDMVLMDIQMPGMDGLEATRRIRKNNKLRDLPIVAMTAHAMVGDREKSLTAGMNDHVNKPVEPAVLYATLQRWIPARQVGVTPAPAFPAEEDSEHCAEFEQLPDMPGIDKVKGLRSLNNKARLFLTMLHDFRVNFSGTPKIIRQWAAAGAWQETRAKVHTIRGVAGYIGASRLLESAGALEDALKSKKIDEATTLLPSFLAALDEALNSLASLPERKAAPKKPPGLAQKGFDPRGCREKLEILIRKLRQGELVPDELITEIETELSDQYKAQATRLVELLDDIEYEAAAGVAAEILAGLPR